MFNTSNIEISISHKNNSLNRKNALRMDFCIYWTCTLKAKRRICEVLGIPTYTSVNGETYFQTNKPHIITQLEDLQERKFIKIRHKPKPS